MACNVVSIAAFLLFIHVPYYVYVYADYQPYVVCGAPSSCANLGNITYPFWTSFRPDYCGHPAFRLKCGGDFAEINIASRSYRVLGINQVTNVLTIARTDYWNNGLCTADPANTTFDPAFFKYTSYTRMAFLYYNCQLLSSGLYLGGSEKLDCSLDGNFTYYFSRYYSDADLYAACEESVVIPVLKDRQENRKMDSVGVVRSGFSLIWKANNKFCYDCRRSGGQCGYHTTSGDFACHCRYGSHPITCRSNGGKLPNDEHYLNCGGSFECGSLGTVGYPFWESRWPQYCGHPDFKLYCSENATTITIVSETYQVLEINQATHTFRVSKSNEGAYACQAGHNSSILLGSTFFEHTENNEGLVIYYDCPPSISSNVTDTAYNCYAFSGNGTQFPNVNIFLTETMRRQYKARGISLTNFAATCNESAVFRTSKSASRVLENYASEQSSGFSFSLGVDGSKIDEAISSGIWLGWKEARNGERCNDCEASGGVCGYDSNSDEFRCNCRDQPYPSTCGSSSGLSATKLNMIIGISAGLFVLIVTSTVTIYLFSKKAVRWKAKNDEFDVEGFMRNHGSFAPKRYFYSNVKKMTKSFAEKIGKGGYGAVYKGKLPDGTLVAVKVLKESKGNGEEFINEVASIGRTSHVNVVTLLGFCYESNKRALIYEYLPNGSLDKFIFNRDSLSIDSRLGWKTLYDITTGIARGLEYLHRGCATRILHFDIKPHNILLDNDFCPKISDFGLAKLCQREDSVVSMKGARGTAGYIAPEMYCRNFGRVSYKSDVYSYGMMVLEMVGGRKNIDVGVSRTSEIYFPYWIHNQFEMGDKLDLGGAISNEDEEIARKMILVSLWCIQTIPSDRPSMSKVVEMLEGSVQSIEIPPKPTLSFAGH